MEDFISYNDNQRHTILVAEDSIVIQKIMDQILEFNNYNRFFAANGQIALDIIKNKKIDMLISDINMPGMSGLQLLHEIKSNYKTPPPTVMMITAYGDEESYNKAMSEGANDFLTKPLDFNLLKEKLKNI